ncbi:TetR/AcrR family transcriptional regulator [Microbulbifer agarilyticus]
MRESRVVAPGAKTPASLEKYNRIIAAGTALFAEKGFHGTTVPEVARKAKVGSGTIYLYFANKEDLVNGVFQSCKSKLSSYLARGVSYDDNADLRESFRTVWQNLCEFAVQNPQEFSFLELHEHSKYLNRESRLLEISVLAPFRLFICKGKRAGIIKDMPAIMLIAMVWGLFVGLFKADVHGYTNITDAALQSAERLCWQMIAR